MFLKCLWNSGNGELLGFQKFKVFFGISENLFGLQDGLIMCTYKRQKFPFGALLSKMRGNFLVKGGSVV